MRGAFLVILTLPVILAACAPARQLQERDDFPTVYLRRTFPLPVVPAPGVLPRHALERDA